MEKYDLLVIGGGECGLAAAKQGATLGARVAMAEPGAVGGTCLSRGCIPKKALVRSAYVYHLVKGAELFGIRSDVPSVNWSRVMERKDRLLRQLELEKCDSLDALSVPILRGKAKFVSPHELLVGEQTVLADRVVLAVGSRAAKVPISGAELAMTSDHALALRELPESVVIVGGGVIAMEFAHIWNRFGVRVSVVEMGERILGTMDAQVATELARLSADRGIEILTNARLEQIRRADGGYSVRVQLLEKTRDIDCKAVLLAAGRVPNVDGLGLEAAGVGLERGRVVVDRYLQTSVGSIYCGGDAIGGYCLAPVAAYEGRLAALNALRGNTEMADYSTVAYTVFSLPPVSSVGLTESQARDAVGRVGVGILPMASVPRAVVEGETDGFIKVVTDAVTGRILGAHIVGSRSEELIHIFSVAMKGMLTREQLADVIPVHPSFAEGAVEATKSAGKVLDGEERCRAVRRPQFGDITGR
ncbi:MAG TPA: NAD(P)/FAD-dependent oxidoreductase [Chloroflexota bacterium]|nr:NAD(P)/FAD-dependent oxidoreductase [Chloroflexota bacterium]